MHATKVWAITYWKNKLNLSLESECEMFSLHTAVEFSLAELFLLKAILLWQSFILGFKCDIKFILVENT